MSTWQGDRNAGRLALYAAFAGAAFRYWLLVFPRVGAELRRARASARTIEPAPRALALVALAKRGNIEGAAAFAAFVPPSSRRAVVRALVAFQAIYNYTDLLAEQPGPDPVPRARRLHEALLTALEPLERLPPDGEPRAEATAGGPPRLEDPFLAGLVLACRAALADLPSYAAVAPLAHSAAERIVAFQSLSIGHGGELERWAEAQRGEADGGEGADGRPTGSFAWWEIAAGAGSSLAVHALIAAAGSPGLGERGARRIHDAYAPAICALHSLLDSLVDRAEDAETGQLSLIGLYSSPQEAADRLVELAREAVAAVAELPRPCAHVVLVAAMACNYLVDLRGAEVAGAPGAALGPGALDPRVRRALGPAATPAMLVFALRRLAGQIGSAGRPRASRPRSPSPGAGGIAARGRGASPAPPRPRAPRRRCSSCVSS